MATIKELEKRIEELEKKIEQLEGSRSEVHYHYYYSFQKQPDLKQIDPGSNPYWIGDPINSEPFNVF